MGTTAFAAQYPDVTAKHWAKPYIDRWSDSGILKGYPDGSLVLDGTLTRAQALVMLTRAFGGFASPVGDNVRMVLPTGSLTNVPAWAAEELSSVLAAGLADGDANEAMSAEALSTLLRRAYAAKGTNLRDDYYAAVNKSWLDGSDIPAGLSRQLGKLS